MPGHNSCHGCIYNPNPLMEVATRPPKYPEDPCMCCYDWSVPTSEREGWLSSEPPDIHRSCIGCKWNDEPDTKTVRCTSDYMRGKCEGCYEWKFPLAKRHQWEAKDGEQS